MRRHRLHAVALVLIWIGGIEVMASFLVKYWFQFNMTLTPYFFLILLGGIGLYVFSRIV